MHVDGREPEMDNGEDCVSKDDAKDWLCKPQESEGKEDDGKYHGKCMSCLKESTHELKAKEDAKPTVGASASDESVGVRTPVPASVWNLWR